MRYLVAILVFLAAPNFGPMATAAILSVERDGSGDFTTIQAAIDAASPGDEIVLGPGRYTETTTRNAGGATQQIYIYVTKPNLTIRGVDRESVFIGPAQGPWRNNHVGALAEVTVPDMRIESLTIEFMEGGATAKDILEVQDCTFRGCHLGINSITLVKTEVVGSSFVDNTGTGIVVFDFGNPGVEVVIRDCEFSGTDGAGIDLQTSNNVVEDCRFQDNAAGIQFSFAASGSISRCAIEGGLVGITIIGGSTAVLSDNIIQGSEGNLFLAQGSHVSGERNLFAGGSYSTITIVEGTTELRNCHILAGSSGQRVRVTTTVPPAHIVDLAYNYWGTTDPSAIADSILDATDGYPSITGKVVFEPILGAPVSARDTSFGGLKAQFGSDGEE